MAFTLTDVLRLEFLFVIQWPHPTGIWKIDYCREGVKRLLFDFSKGQLVALSRPIPHRSMMTAFYTLCGSVF